MEGSKITLASFQKRPWLSALSTLLSVPSKKHLPDRNLASLIKQLYLLNVEHIAEHWLEDFEKNGHWKSQHHDLIKLFQRLNKPESRASEALLKKLKKQINRFSREHDLPETIFNLYALKKKYLKEKSQAEAQNNAVAIADAEAALKKIETLQKNEKDSTSPFTYAAFYHLKKLPFSLTKTNEQRASSQDQKAKIKGLSAAIAVVVSVFEVIAMLGFVTVVIPILPLALALGGPLFIKNLFSVYEETKQAFTAILRGKLWQQKDGSAYSNKQKIAVAVAITASLFFSTAVAVGTFFAAHSGLIMLAAIGGGLMATGPGVLVALGLLASVAAIVLSAYLIHKTVQFIQNDGVNRLKKKARDLVANFHEFWRPVAWNANTKNTERAVHWFKQSIKVFCYGLLLVPALLLFAYVVVSSFGASTERGVALLSDTLELGDLFVESFSSAVSGISVTAKLPETFLFVKKFVSVPDAIVKAFSNVKSTFLNVRKTLGILFSHPIRALATLFSAVKSIFNAALIGGISATQTTEVLLDTSHGDIDSSQLDQIVDSVNVVVGVAEGALMDEPAHSVQSAQAEQRVVKQRGRQRADMDVDGVLPALFKHGIFSENKKGDVAIIGSIQTDAAPRGVNRSMIS